MEGGDSYPSLKSRIRNIKKEGTFFNTFMYYPDVRVSGTNDMMKYVVNNYKG